MEKKYPVIAGRERGKLFLRGRIIQSVYDMCKGRLLVQHKGFFFSTVQTCQNLPVSGEKMLPLAVFFAHSHEHMYADAVLCPLMCTCILHARCLSYTVHMIDEQSPAVSSRSPGCQSSGLQAGHMQKNA